jgi:hypothetical protein
MQMSQGQCYCESRTCDGLPHPTTETETESFHQRSRNMAQINHPLTFVVEPDLLKVGHFRWTLREGDRIELRSPRSYQSRLEATGSAKVALRKLIIAWPGATRAEDEETNEAPARPSTDPGLHLVDE